MMYETEKKMKKVFGVAVLMMFLASCSMLHSLGFRSYKNSFTENLAKHTKKTVLYRDFTTIAIVKVTHFNKNLMEQYIEYTQNAGSVEKKYKKYSKVLKEYDKYDIFWVAFYTDDDDINNLADKNSFWNIYLVRNSHTFMPVSIKEVDLSSFKKQWLYLIKAHRWAREYIIKFKKSDVPAKQESLVIASYLGTMDFKFDN